jgi:hypothetical protein
MIDLNKQPRQVHTKEIFAEVMRLLSIDPIAKRLVKLHLMMNLENTDDTEINNSTDTEINNSTDTEINSSTDTEQEQEQTDTSSEQSGEGNVRTGHESSTDAVAQSESKE